MLWSFLTGATINRLLALIALILAFPPVFTKRGHTEGLLMSLSLVIFYLLKGFMSMADVSSFSKTLPVRPSQFFAFAEIPSLFVVIYVGLKCLPEWLAVPYQYLILASGPLFIILEGVCSMIIILECGERCSDALSETSALIKAFVAMTCFGVFGVSFYGISEIYSSGLLSIPSASFVASVCTTLLALTMLTIYIEHGTITDASMLCLYVTYNIWCIARSWKDHFLSAVQIDSVFDYLTNPSLVFTSAFYPMTNGGTILSVISSLASMFSVEIVVHLMIQMCVFVLAIKLIGKALRQSVDDGDGDQGNQTAKKTTSNNNADGHWLAYQDWIFNVLWPSFGKLTLVLVYTYAWIVHTRPDLVHLDWPWCKPTTWRYVNVVMVLMIYLKHLLTCPDDPVLFKLD